MESGSQLEVVPTALRAAQRLRQRVTENGGVLIGAGVVAFPQLVSLVLPPQFRHAQGPVLSRVGADQLLRITLESTAGSSLVGLRTPGARRAVLRFMSDLAKVGVGPGEISSLVGSAAPLPPRLEMLIAAEGLYHRARERLSLDDADSRDRSQADAVAAAMDDPQWVSRIPITAVDLHGFVDLTAQQVRILAALTSRFPVTVHVPVDDQRGLLFHRVQETRKALEQASSAIKIRPEPLAATGTLRLILDNLDGTQPPGPPIPTEPRNVHCERPDDEGAQLESMARRVRSLLSANVDPGRIGVVFRSLVGRAAAVEDTFRRHGLAPRYRRGDPLLAHPLIRLVRSALEMPRLGWPPAAVVELVTSSYTRPRSTLPSPDGRTPRSLESLLLAAHVRELTPTGPGRRALTSRRQLVGEADAPIRPPSLVVLDLMLERLDRLHRPATVRTFVAQLREFMESFGWSDAPDFPDDDDLSARDASALSALQSSLDEMEATATHLGRAEREESHDTLVDWWLGLMMEASHFPAAPDRPGIWVLSAEDARGLPLGHVLVGGLLEREFPAPMGRDPLLGPDERSVLDRAWNRTGRPGSLVPTAVLHEASERLTFWQVLSEAQEATIYAPVQDSRGAPTMPSPLFDEVRALVDGPAADGPASVEDRAQVDTAADLTLRTVRRLVRPSPTDLEGQSGAHLDALIRRMSLDPVLGGPFRHSLDSALIDRQREDFFMERDVSRRLEAAGPFTGRLFHGDESRARDQAVLRRLGHRYAPPQGLTLSATQLEAYGKCPFHFLMAKTFALEAPRTLELELERRDRGTLLHEVLEAVVRALVERGDAEGNPFHVGDPVPDARWLDTRVDSVCDAWETHQDTGHPAIWTVFRRRLRRELALALAAEHRWAGLGWRPTHFEQSFGPGRAGQPVPQTPSLPALDVLLPDGSRVALGGSVDRIDMRPGGVRVVDYKATSNASPYKGLLQDEAVGVTSFQMPIYLALASTLLDPSGELNASFVVCTGCETADAKAGSRVLDRQFLSLKVSAEEFTLGSAIATSVDRWKKGVFPVIPHDCSHCDFQPACRIPDTTRDEETE